MAAVLGDIRFQGAQHGFCVLHHPGAVSGIALDKPLGQRKFGAEGGTSQQVRVGGFVASQGIGLHDSVHESRFMNGNKPGKIVGRVSDPQLGPAHDGRDLIAVEQDIVLMQVSVDDAGVEAPQCHILHGVLPTAQQRRRDLSGGG